MGRQSNLPPTFPAIRRDDAVAAAYLSLSPSKFMELVARGIMPAPKRIDGRLICDLEDVRAAFKVLPNEGEKKQLDTTWEDIDKAT